MALRPVPFALGASADEPSSLAARMRTVSAFGARHRRLVAAVCAGAAVVVTVSALTPAPPASGPGAPGGLGPAAGAAVLPAGAGGPAPEIADRVAVAVRLADPAGLLLLRVGGHAEVLAGPAPDPAGTGVAATTTAPEGEVLARDAVVLAVPRDQAPGGAAGSGGSGLLGEVSGGAPAAAGPSGLDGVVLLAVPPLDARRLAAASGNRALSVAVAMPAGPSSAP